MFLLTFVTKHNIISYNKTVENRVLFYAKQYVVFQSEYGVSKNRLTVILYAHLQDALRAVQFVLRAVDNAIALSNLQGCPFSLDKDHMIRTEPFIVYTSKNAKKSKPHESYVFLHRDYVLFTQATLDEANDITNYEYTDSLQVNSIPMVW